MLRGVIPRFWGWNTVSLTVFLFIDGIWWFLLQNEAEWVLSSCGFTGIDFDIEILGFLPSDSKITLKKANLGLISPMDNGKEIDIEYFANFAERNLDVFSLIKFLKSPQKKIFNSVNFKDFKILKLGFLS